MGVNLESFLPFLLDCENKVGLLGFWNVGNGVLKLFPKDTKPFGRDTPRLGGLVF